MCYPEGTLTVQRFYNSHKSHIILLDGIGTRTTLFFLVYRTFGGQGVCLAGRCVHKYHKRPVGSGHYARQLRLKQQDRRNLSLGKKKKETEYQFSFWSNKVGKHFQEIPVDLALAKTQSYCLNKMFWLLSTEWTRETSYTPFVMPCPDIP